MTDRYRRDLRGRFVSTANTRESGDGRFETFIEMPVEIQGADPADLAYDTVPRYAPEGDTLAGYGSSYGASPLRARNPELVHPDDTDHTVYGRQGAILRTAARGSGPMDPTPFLVGLAVEDGR